MCRMRVVSLVFCIFLSIFVILSLSMAVQATEYKEVKAEEILKQIEDGEDVNLTDCHIVGELDVSKIKLETVPNPVFDLLLKEGWSERDIPNLYVKENTSVVKSNIKIKNSTFENSIDFSNVYFNNSPFPPINENRQGRINSPLPILLLFT